MLVKKIMDVTEQG